MARRPAAGAPSRGDRSPGNRTGCLIWLAMLLVTLVLFVLNWDRIQKTVASSGLSDAIKAPAPSDPGKAKPTGQSGPDAPKPASGDGSVEPAPAKPTQPAVKPGDAKPADAKPGDAKPADVKPADAKSGDAKPVAIKPGDAKPGDAKPGDAKPGDAKPGDAKPGAAKPGAASPLAAPVEQVRSTRMATLYFVRVDDDGVISRREVKRTVGASDSPMTDSLEALMAGPDADELSRGMISLIPAGTKLLSAQVRGSTAYLNFSESFMYNRYGVEGYAGQLKQVVYTATTFPNVKDVQILIEGKKVEYLGGDGVYIGKPLSRASF